MRLGRPQKSETYEQIEIDGIKVYYRSSIEGVFPKLIVKVEKLLFFKYLVVTTEK